MIGIKKDTIGDVLTVLGAVLVFNGLIKLKFVGDYITKYPLIIFIIGILLIIFRNKIANVIGD